MTTPKDDGGAAFPRTPMADLRDDTHLGEIGAQQKGMTLRQWYAGQALPAVLNRMRLLVTKNHPRIVALEAVQYADAIIAELARTSK